MSLRLRFGFRVVMLRFRAKRRYHEWRRRRVRYQRRVLADSVRRHRAQRRRLEAGVESDDPLPTTEFLREITGHVRIVLRTRALLWWAGVVATHEVITDARPP